MKEDMAMRWAVIGAIFLWAVLVLVTAPTVGDVLAAPPPIRATAVSVTVPPTTAKLVQGSVKGTLTIRTIEAEWDKRGRLRLVFTAEYRF